MINSLLLSFNKSGLKSGYTRGAEVKSSQVTLRIILPILTKVLQKSQIHRAILKNVAKQSAK
jgi:hypothetical protein